MGMDVEKVLELGKDVTVPEGTKREGRRGKWDRELILKIGKWVSENCEVNSGKAYTVEQVYDIFYKGREVSKEELFADPARVRSFSNTFIKTANTILRNEGIDVRIHKRGDDLCFVKIIPQTQKAKEEKEE